MRVTNLTPELVAEIQDTFQKKWKNSLFFWPLTKILDLFLFPVKMPYPNDDVEAR